MLYHLLALNTFFFFRQSLPLNLELSFRYIDWLKFQGFSLPLLGVKDMNHHLQLVTWVLCWFEWEYLSWAHIFEDLIPSLWGCYGAFRRYNIIGGSVSWGWSLGTHSLTLFSHSFLCFFLVTVIWSPCLLFWLLCLLLLLSCWAPIMDSPSEISKPNKLFLL